LNGEAWSVPVQRSADGSFRIEGATEALLPGPGRWTIALELGDRRFTTEVEWQR
jgi:hypothetical protein